MGLNHTRLPITPQTQTIVGPPGFEPGQTESKSVMLTITSWSSIQKTWYSTHSTIKLHLQRLIIAEMSGFEPESRPGHGNEL